MQSAGRSGGKTGKPKNGWAAMGSFPRTGGPARVTPTRTLRQPMTTSWPRVFLPIGALRIWCRGGLEHGLYLRAAAPAADPGKEKPVMVSAGFVRVFCESSAWMLYIYIIYIYASNSIYLYVEVKFC